MQGVPCRSRDSGVGVGVQGNKRRGSQMRERPSWTQKDG